MFRVSKETPAYYLTSVAKNRLPVFRTDQIAKLTCDAINEARNSGNFVVLAYVIMPDHIHLVTDSSRKSKDIHRFVNGIVSRRVIDYPKEKGHAESLNKLKTVRSDGSQYSLWQRHPDTRLFWNEDMLWQRMQYIPTLIPSGPGLPSTRMSVDGRAQGYFINFDLTTRRLKSIWIRSNGGDKCEA
jgi:REP element-mobilizing transposase RayT